MRALPPLDLHAHIDTGIAAAELTALQAVVFAVTRSLDEAARALNRSDGMTIWGVGMSSWTCGGSKGLRC